MDYKASKIMNEKQIKEEIRKIVSRMEQEIEDIIYKNGYEDRSFLEYSNREESFLLGLKESIDIIYWKSGLNDLDEQRKEMLKQIKAMKKKS